VLRVEVTIRPEQAPVEPVGLSRIEAQFDLTTGSPLKRIVAGAVMLALGGNAAPRPQARDEELSKLIANSLRVDAGYRVNYFEGGDSKGRPVVFIHGSPGSGRGWVDYLLHAPPGFRHVAIDRPGFGASGPRDAVVSVPEQANAVASVVRALRSGPAILVGHSFGGPVAVQTAADAPDLVAGLVLLASALDPAQERVPFAQHIGDAWPVRELLPRALRNANRELIGLKGELARLKSKLSAIKVPVVIVHGADDKLVPVANVAFMKSYMIGASPLDVTEMEGQDHFLPWNAKRHVDAAIAKTAALIDERQSSQPALRNSDA
jgi:pimeloyl-ACP methyl ester carboxylesterase